MPRRHMNKWWAQKLLADQSDLISRLHALNDPREDFLVGAAEVADEDLAETEDVVVVEVSLTTHFFSGFDRSSPGPSHVSCLRNNRY
jgi:hypothetical protein